MNAVENKSAKCGKVYTRVVFLMAQNPYTDLWEPMALFPDLYWDEAKKENVSYQHNGQHGPCCKAFALLDCKVPSKKQMKAVLRLKNELEHLDEPYVLTVLDAAEWMEQNADLAREYARNSKHYEQAEEEQAAMPQTDTADKRDEQMDFLNALLDDGFSETTKAISELFDEEFGELSADSDNDYSDLDDDELLYPPTVVENEPNLMAELQARVA